MTLPPTCWPRSRAIQDRERVASAGLESLNPVLTVKVSGSMSVCMKRLNRTSPSAPAFSRRSAISPNELK